MGIRDALGLILAATGLLLLALGQSVLGPRWLLCGTVLLMIGILVIYLAKRRHETSYNSDGDVNLPGDEHHLPDD
ncbi:hypothetical protein ACFQ09_14880 [Massilia norwichensis]|jgi:uncharacterized membrane protein|uniref:LPXTG cell wall anchor domain-containing protein n=1 Tax=Massilia norwichensis TaxID=1442366 RepID=A0ABT2A9S5_9BURK|nr:hypothetical protein [Massilia norwichensis]MCS0590550.1 hypothetical protein [Massilia norwichensis]